MSVLDDTEKLDDTAVVVVDMAAYLAGRCAGCDHPRQTHQLRTFCTAAGCRCPRMVRHLTDPASSIGLFDTKVRGRWISNPPAGHSLRTAAVALIISAPGGEPVAIAGRYSGLVEFIDKLRRLADDLLGDAICPACMEQTHPAGPCPQDAS